ncbi:hypothetical protein B0H14DRAFT_3650098 [Mycena olivaceomarginata]|nr:hypothetical protein B0H14DRAFT_3650098 [Mycena olivaceomarginata]
MPNSSGIFQRESNENALAHCEEYRIRYQRRAVKQRPDTSEIQCPKKEIGGSTATKSASTVARVRNNPNTRRQVGARARRHPRQGKAEMRVRRGGEMSDRSPSSKSPLRERSNKRTAGRICRRETRDGGPREGECCTVDGEVKDPEFPRETRERDPGAWIVRRMRVLSLTAVAVRWTTDGRRTPHRHPRTEPPHDAWTQRVRGRISPLISLLPIGSRGAPHAPPSKSFSVAARVYGVHDEEETAHEDYRMPQPHTTPRQPQRAPIRTSSRRGEERKDAASGVTGQRRTTLASGCELDVRNGAAAREASLVNRCPAWVDTPSAQIAAELGQADGAVAGGGTSGVWGRRWKTHLQEDIEVHRKRPQQGHVVARVLGTSGAFVAQRVSRESDLTEQSAAVTDE